MAEIEMLTIKEAGKLISGITEYRLRTMCISGELPCLHAGKKYLINKNILFKYINGELPQRSASDTNKSCIKRVDL